MPLRAIQSQSLGDQVFEQLTREILTGHFAPGDQLPSERALVTTFRVNRHVVREALKRILQLGLVRSNHGGGTVVLDFKNTAGLDLMALMAEHSQADAETMSYWLAIHEMRAALGADAARLCALRGPEELKAKLVAIANRMVEIGDGPGLFDLEIEFWDLVIDGSGNIAYRLGYNTLIKGVLAKATIDVARTWSIHEIKEDGYRVVIAGAIADGNAKQAEARTRESMNKAVAFLGKQFEVAGEAPDTASPMKRARATPRRVR
jgi:DNA-binding FadR family transcriptional regulator